MGFRGSRVQIPPSRFASRARRGGKSLRRVFANAARFVRVFWSNPALSARTRVLGRFENAATRPTVASFMPVPAGAIPHNKNGAEIRAVQVLLTFSFFSRAP